MPAVYGVSGYQAGTATSLVADKLPKKDRVVKLTTGSGAGGNRPTSGQLYPRTA